MANLIPLEHPGIILSEEFLEPLEITPYALSKGTGISQTAIGEIIKGNRNISPVNALRFSKFLGVSDHYFLNIQMRYNLDLAKEKNTEGLAKILPFQRPVVIEEELLEA